MLYVNDCLSECTDERLKLVLDALPTWRKEQALRFRHRDGIVECALSYTLLCDALRERGIMEAPTFVYGPDGKPSLLEHPEIHFNLSHTRGVAVCVIADHPVGVDVENTGRYSEDLAKYTMNAEELQQINAAADSDLEFTRLWTMKEATGKLIGEGITTNVKRMLTTHSYNIIYGTTVNSDRGYVVTQARWAKDV